MARTVWVLGDQLNRRIGALAEATTFSGSPSPGLSPMAISTPISRPSRENRRFDDATTAFPDGGWKVVVPMADHTIGPGSSSQK